MKSDARRLYTAHARNLGAHTGELSVVWWSATGAVHRGQYLEATYACRKGDTGGQYTARTSNREASTRHPWSDGVSQGQFTRARYATKLGDVRA